MHVQELPVSLLHGSPAREPSAARAGALCSFYIWTIGCQMNRADSDRLGSALGQLGLSEARSPGEADVIVLNSCVVRQSAEDRVVGNLGLLKPLKARRPDRITALMGCMVGPRDGELRHRFPYVDHFMPPQEFGPLLAAVGQRLGVDPHGCLGPLAPSRAQTTAYVPVVHGCDLFCTFCIVPYRRGRQASRPVREVLEEVELLASRGVREVTLLGQTVDAYGHDLPGGADLADLLRAVHDVREIERIRFLTSHPAYMSEPIVRAVADLDRVCKHINLPVQSGDDAVLAAMRRTYTRDEYLGLVDRIRRAVPGVGLSTDVIVGFCGETEEQFRSTLDLLSSVRFDKVHIAQYSPRRGTIAERRLEDTVPPEEKHRRFKEMEALQERIAAEKNTLLLGTSLPVLVEGRERGRWKGRTSTDKLVFFEGGNRDYLGRMVDVRIDWTGPWSLLGVPDSPGATGG